jgi:hypothetical protein
VTPQRERGNRRLTFSGSHRRAVGQDPRRSSDRPQHEHEYYPAPFLMAVVVVHSYGLAAPRVLKANRGTSIQFAPRACSVREATV